MSERRSIPTMKDVAREAGVSLGTVSKVINGYPVGESYVKKVREAIEKLDYRVNSYAKGLKSNKTYTIAVMMPNLLSPFFSSLANSINAELTKRKHHMIFFATDYEPEREQEMVRLAEQQKVDGIICLSYNPNLTVSKEVPLVSIDRYFGAEIPCVSSDNYGGGVLAAMRLIEGGCKNLAFLRIGSRLTNEPNKRKDGFISACEEAGVPYTLKMVDDYTPYKAFEDFLKGSVKKGKLIFDGIFCVTDSLAHQILITLRDMGVKVPEEVQVIGFDGVRYFGDLEYMCSTIVQPVEAIAAACVDTLLEKHLGKVPSLMCLPVSYAYGGTTRA